MCKLHRMHSILISQVTRKLFLITYQTFTMSHSQDKCLSNTGSHNYPCIPVTVHSSLSFRADYMLSLNISCGPQQKDIIYVQVTMARLVIQLLSLCYTPTSIHEIKLCIKLKNNFEFKSRD